VDADGVVRVVKPGSSARRAALVAAGLVLLALVWLFFDVRGDVRGEARDDAATAPGQRGEVASRSQPSTPRPALGTPGGSDGPDRGQADGPDDADQPEVYVNQLEPPPGEKTGIHLFPPPGTKPIKGGIIVPDGYQLPPGYVRHFQATDDGEPVQAILMFHPDHRPLDADGRPIPLPADRVVPPEMAPPGMPIEMLEAPPVRRDFDETSTPR
jgi:hypothetical protein